MYVEKDTIKDVFDALPATTAAVVPQKNSIFGSVVETYDCLRDRGFVCGEITLQIQHCLLVCPGVQLADIKTVLSHEQVRHISVWCRHPDLWSRRLLASVATSSGTTFREPL